VIFAQAAWLWLLPLLLPLVFLLHARRRRDLPVASLVIWRRVADEVSAAPQRRRFPWRDPRLWVQLMAVTAATLALAGPVLGTAAPAGVHWVVLLDASVTMRATDVTPDRFSAATTLAVDRWGAGHAGRDDTVTLFRAGPVATSLVAASWRPGIELERLLLRQRPSDGVARWSEAAARAWEVRASDSAARVVVLTDAYGAGPASAALAAVGGADWGDVIVFGDTLANVGVGDVTASPRGTRPGAWTVGGHVASVGLDRGEVVRIVAAYRPFGGDTFLPWGATDVTLGSAGDATFEIFLDLPGPGEVEIRGPRGDLLEADDRVVVVLRPDPVRIAIVGPQEPALLRALRAIGGLELFHAESVPDPDDAAAFDLVIVTGGAEGVPETSTLWFGPVPPVFAAEGPLVGPTALLDAGPHVLMRDVDPTAIEIGRAHPLLHLAGATPLLRAGHQTVAWARTTTSGRQIVLGFGVDDSSWPAQLSFPAFVAAVVEWSAPRSWRAPGGCRVGDACPWPAEAFAGGWLLHDPAGSVVSAPLGLRDVGDDPAARAVWDEAVFEAGFRPERAGRYALHVDGGSIGLPVIGVRVSGSPDVAGTVLPEPVAAPSRIDLWRVLATVAVALALADLVLTARARSPGPRRRPWAPPVLAGIAVLAWLAAGVGVPVPAIVPGGHATLVADGAPAAHPARERAASWRPWTWDRVDVVPVGSRGTGSDVDAAMEAHAADDLASAIELALALPTATDERRIVVATDGERSLAASDLVSLAARSLAQGVQVDLVPPEGAPTAAVTGATSDRSIDLVRVSVPETVRAGSRFTIAATVRAPEDQTWRIDVVEGADQVGAEAWVAAAAAEGRGAATVRIEVEAGEPGDAAYRIDLVVDDVPSTTATVVVAVGPRPNVLVVTEGGFEGTLLAEALEAQSIDHRVVVPRAMPNTIARMEPYDAVVLVNVPAVSVFTAYQEILEVFVREMGRGLVILGGPNAYGPGGYYRTPLEELSPLSAQIEQDAPEVALAFVLDRSGSMNAPVGSSTRMDVAKLATMEALATLSDESFASLIVFDAEAELLLPMMPVTEVRVFQEALASVHAGGGTAIHPGLLLAYDVMLETESATRHVVVMTDGLSQAGDFPGVLGDLRALGVTTSFVGIGDGADRGQLTTLANLGGGALHMATDFRALPSILAQEAMMLSADPIEERLTIPAWTAGPRPSFLQGLSEEPPPPLLGFVRTTAKDGAAVHMVERDGEDPLLASWRYGLGRVIAFASEVDGPWAQAWLDDPDFPLLWSQVVRWTAERAIQEGWALQVAAEPSRLDVVVTRPVAPPSPTPTLRATLVDGEGTVLARRSLLPAGGGDRFGARFELGDEVAGVYGVRIEADAETGLEAPLERLVVLPAAPTRGVRGDDTAVLGLVNATGGVARDSAESIGRVGYRMRQQAMPTVWLLLGLGAFMAALFVRYGAASALRGRMASMGPGRSSAFARR
jgi:hypothetical protein